MQPDPAAPAAGCQHSAANHHLLPLFCPLWALFSLPPSLGLPHQSLQTLRQRKGLLPLLSSPIHQLSLRGLGSHLGDSPLPQPFLLLSREREGEQSLGGGQGGRHRLWGRSGLWHTGGPGSQRPTGLVQREELRQQQWPRPGQ